MINVRRHTMNIQQTDIFIIVNDFKSKSNLNDRFTSFDFCYNYFYHSDSNYLINNMEKSCLTLGFYLASWGMFRNSFLLNKSIKYYQPTINYIASLDKSVWQIDVDNYTDDNIDTILDIYRDVKELLVEDGCSDLTLVTKVLLGVFGFIPAFDDYFCKTFREMADGRCGFRKVNKDSLTQIRIFYEANSKAIDDIATNTFTLDFTTEQKTTTNYTKAKIIDMYGFNKRR
jgi:hypothetical protein